MAPEPVTLTLTFEPPVDAADIQERLTELVDRLDEEDIDEGDIDEGDIDEGDIDEEEDR